MRTFVAIEVSDENVIKRIQTIQSDISINAKTVNPNNLHFTLQFLGDVSEDMVGKITDALSMIEFSSFDVSFKGLGVFPKPSFPRVIWIGTKKGKEELVDLAEKVHSALLPLGFKSDKPFKPHITIFRLKNKIDDISKKLEKYSSEEFGSQKINSIKFKKSVLTPNGPIYTDLMEVKSN